MEGLNQFHGANLSLDSDVDKLCRGEVVFFISYDWKWRNVVH